MKFVFGVDSDVKQILLGCFMVLRFFCFIDMLDLGF